MKEKLLAFDYQPSACSEPGSLLSESAYKQTIEVNYFRQA